MDNARWFVILSVVFSMMVTLSLLNRYAGGQQPKQEVVSQQAVANAPRNAETVKSVVNRPTRREIPHFGQIRFSKPAAHTLVID